MRKLTLDLDSSAELLGTEPDAFIEFVSQKSIQGIIKIQDHWRVSIFTLAQLLNTSPASLLTLIEDDILAQMIEQHADDECFTGDEAFRLYQSYVAGSEA